MLFRTTYYTLRLKVKNSLVEFVKPKIRLDYEDKEFIKYEKITDIFKEELREIDSEYEVVVDTTSLDSNVSVFIDGEFLVIASISESMKSSDIVYDLFQDDSYIKISVSNSNNDVFYTYSLTVIDDEIEYKYEFLEEVMHRYKSKKLTIKIDRLFNGSVSKSIERDIILNDLSKTDTGDYFVPIEEGDANGKEKFFTTGKEIRDISVRKVAEKEYHNFDLNLDLLKDVVNISEVYPLVKARYDKSCTYNYDIPDVFSRIEWRTVISASSKATFHVKKYAASVLGTKIEVFGKILHQEGGDFKLTDNSYVYEGEIDLYKFIEVDGSGNFYIDLKGASRDLSRSFAKSVRSALLEGTPWKNADISSLRIKVKGVTIDNVLSDSKLLTAHFYSGGINKVDLSKGLQVIIAPFLGVYEGDAILTKKHDGEVGGRQKVISAEEVDALPMFDQKGKPYDGKGNKYRCVITCVDSKLAPHIEIGKNEVYMHPAEDTVLSAEQKLTIDEPCAVEDLKKYIGKFDLNSDYKATFTFTPFIDDVIVNGVEYKKGTTHTLELDASKDAFIVSMIGIQRMFEAEETVKDDNNGQGYEISCNGNESEYLLDSKGKEDTSSKMKPLQVPHFARNIRYSSKVLSIVPSASEKYTRITTNSDCSVINMSSDYKETISRTNIEYEERFSFKGFGMYTNTKREIVLEIIPKVTKEFYINVSSSNPSIVVDFPKKLSLVAGERKRVRVMAYSSTTELSQIDVAIEPCYHYKNGHEYFMYDGAHKAVVNGYKYSLNYAKTSLTPMCVTNGVINLRRIISNSTDGISITEKISNDKGVHYTKYCDIFDVSLIKKDGATHYPKDVYKNFVMLNSDDYETISYKVRNSFDYAVKDGKTNITFSDRQGSVNIYDNRSEDIELNVDINPLNNVISKGYICVGGVSKSISKATLFSYKVKDNYFLNYIEILDESYDPYIGDVKVLANNTSYSLDTDRGFLSFNTYSKVRRCSIGVENTDECEVGIIYA